MLVSKFYRQASCDLLSKLDNLSQEETRTLTFVDAISDMCDMLKKGSSLEQAEQCVNDALCRSYKEEWFSFPWQRERAIKNDTFCVHRFLAWLGTDYTVLHTNHTVSIPVSASLPDGTNELSVKVPLVLQFKSGRYGAILLFNKAADKSLKGKTLHTSVATDLYAMVAKAALEQSFPGICVSNVYLRCEDDSDENMIPTFRVNDTKKSNVFSQTYNAYYEDGVFQRDFFMDVLYSVLAQPMESPCYTCSKQYLCSVKDVRKPSKVDKKTSSTYVLPEYTQTQKEVISHTNGPMLVCAGPGSGKTATLVGRVKRLIDDGVPPELILVITFTTKAADELRERCASFCKEGESPKISTLNALGYEILKAHADLFNTEINLLSLSEQTKLVKALISVTPELTGINYDTYEKGKYGLYKTICDKLNKYCKAQSSDAFFQSEPGLGTDFIPFAEQYKEIISARGYISFDEQVSLCNTLFDEHDDVRQIYSHLYRYIMVDEYQDINAEQAKFIYSIGSHENLVVVGDDDQAVYGFRGASNFFMLNFPKEFPNAKTVVLKDNFRSTQTLVTAAQNLISNNKQRIEKDISCARGNGMSPKIIRDISPSAIDAVVNECLANGYSYGDIAVLSTKNAPLEKLHKAMSVPTVLAKSFLRQDILFLYVYDILMLFDNLDDDSTFYHYFQLFGIDVPLQKGVSVYTSLLSKGYPDVRAYEQYAEYIEDKEYLALRILSNMFFLLESEHVKPSSFIASVEYHTGLENTISSLALAEMLETNCIQTIPALKEYMEYMISFEDDTRIEVGHEDSVLLITSHESKGMEFPVVLMLNDYKEMSEESRRLFYVAMTRAKDRLYIMQDASCKNAFLEEFAFDNAS